MVAALMGLGSCSSNEEVMLANQEETVTVKVQIPQNLKSRADNTLGDQVVADVNNLQWTVFEIESDGTQKRVYSDVKANAFPGNALEEEVTLQLGKGKKYQVAFYADNTENGVVTFSNGIVSVDYSLAASNVVAEDAFTGVSEELYVEDDGETTVVLRRPFAQLNWGTNDLDYPTVDYYINGEGKTDPLSAYLVVTRGGVYTQYDVLNATVVENTEATLPLQLKPAVVSDFSAYNGVAIEFPVENYELVAMNYLLVSENTTIDCQLVFNNGFKTATVSQVPVQRNWRTNIYGAILTNPTKFNIIINPDFQGDNAVTYPQATTPETND